MASFKPKSVKDVPAEEVGSSESGGRTLKEQRLTSPFFFVVYQGICSSFKEQ